MSRSLVVGLEEIANRTREFITNVTSLETKFHMMRMEKQKIECRPLGIFSGTDLPFRSDSSLPQVVTGQARTRQSEGVSRVKGAITSEQKATLDYVSNASKALGYRVEVKAIPYLGQPISFELFMQKEKEKEKVGVRHTGGDHGN
jgi:hypothetical protein